MLEVKIGKMKTYEVKLVYYHGARALFPDKKWELSCAGCGVCMVVGIKGSVDCELETVCVNGCEKHGSLMT